MREIRFAAFAGRAAATTLAASAFAGGGTPVQVTIENLAPQFGTFQTPFWVGFHDGSFDIYDAGAPASTALERLAEDGDTAPIQAAFLGVGATDGVITSAGGPFAPGDVASMTFILDGKNPDHRFFSYASMVIPSNDAFVANGNPMAHMLFDKAGNFVGADFFITGAMVLDAGTEVNDEIPANTAFFGQVTPNTGVNEKGVVSLHPGFLGSLGNPGTPAILADDMFGGADFTIPGYPIARITITQIPAPGALALLGLAGCIAPRRRRT